MSSELPEILTVNELAKALRIGRNAAYELVREDGPIRAIKIGRSIRIPRSAVDAFLRAPRADEDGDRRVLINGAQRDGRDAASTLRPQSQ